MKRRSLCFGFAVAFLLLVSSLCLAAASDALREQASGDVKQRAVATLRAILRESTEFKRVHAAEALLWSGYPQGIETTFLPEEATAAPRYRIGVWRVLAQSDAKKPAIRQRYIGKIRAVFFDRSAPDRIHALETLGKLGWTEHSPEMVQTAEHNQEKLARMARWVVANSRTPRDEALLIELLKSNDPEARGDAAYTLRYFRNLSPALRAALRDCLSKEPADSSARVYVLSAAFVHARGKERKGLKPEVLKYLRAGKPDERYEACFALAADGDKADITLLEPWLQDADSDVRVGAAYALLKILK